MLKLNLDNSYTRLPDSWFQRVNPTPLKNTHLINVNSSLASELGLKSESDSPCDWIAAFTGHNLHPETDPIAMKYAGHQFGVYNKDLGDGRGVLLGEHLAPDGHRWDLHLKGSGPTAFSRFGDGRSVLRSSVREYLASEALHGLGIPTTRALALFGSDQFTMRSGAEHCALLLRTTRCHIRFGHFEHFYYSGQSSDLKRLADYVIQRYYPELSFEENPYFSMFKEVLDRSARLVALWQAYGFVHAVMNTDNMSMLGETFDYGPFTFMDRYEPDHIANKNDERGRYAFANQPSMMKWNLTALAQSLLPLIDRALLESALDSFSDRYHGYYYQRLAQRLALDGDGMSHKPLIDQMLNALADGGGDLNRFIYALMELDKNEKLKDCSGSSKWMTQWLTLFYKVRLNAAQGLPERLAQAKALNPVYTLRNYMCEEAIRDAQSGDYQRIHDLLALVKEPMTRNAALDHYGASPPDWASGIFLTCSS